MCKVKEWEAGNTRAMEVEGTSVQVGGFVYTWNESAQEWQTSTGQRMTGAHMEQIHRVSLLVPEGEIFCAGCGKRPHELPEYLEPAKEENITPAEYVRLEEGTFNPENGHFLCTPCYVAAGQPSSPNGWRAS